MGPSGRASRRLVDEVATAHQWQDAGAELLHADDEVVEGHHHAAHTRHRRHLVEHARDARIAAHQRAHVDVHRPFRRGELADIGGGVVLVGRTLVHQPADRVDIDAVIVRLPLGHGRLVGLVGDDHREDQRAAVAPEFLVDRDQARHAPLDAPRLVLAEARAEIVVGMLRGKAGAGVALPCADDRDARGRERAAAAVVHLEEVAFEVGTPGLPQLPHDGDVFGAVLVAPLVVVGTWPDAHLGVFAPLPAGDDVHAETAVRDAVDRHRHARRDRRRHGEDGTGGEQLDAAGHGREPGH